MWPAQQTYPHLHSIPKRPSFLLQSKQRFLSFCSFLTGRGTQSPKQSRSLQAGVTLDLGVVTGDNRGISSFSAGLALLGQKTSTGGIWDSWAGRRQERRGRSSRRCTWPWWGCAVRGSQLKVIFLQSLGQHFRRNCQLKSTPRVDGHQGREDKKDTFGQSLQPITFSRSSHMRMLLPRTTTLYRILRSLPLISKAFSRAKFMKTSTPITMPSISRPPFNLILSFFATYLLRSGEQPCLGRGRLMALPLPAIYNRLIIRPNSTPIQHITHAFASALNFLQLQMQRERELFESMLCKFVINLPEEELRDSSRLSYHAEKAFYYYIDIVLREQEIKDRDRQRNEFFFKLKQYCPEFVRIDPLQLAARLQENKPVCGAIIFNKDNSKVLVVRVRNKFGFPKGKWNQHETTEACAARQVQEETGLYIHHRIDPKVRIEFETHGSSSYFFVARGVGQQERTRVDKKEIDGVCWMWIEDVRTNLSRFVQRSKIAWFHYEKEIAKQEVATKSQNIEEFIREYGEKKVQQQKTEPDETSFEDEPPNPFLAFKFDKERLRQCLFSEFQL